MDEQEFITEKEEEALRRYRKDALSVKSYAERFIDQTVATLTVGLLGFALAFRDQFRSTQINSCMLTYGMICLGLAVCSVLLNTLLSIHASNSAIKDIDEALISCKADKYTALQKTSWINKTISWLNHIIVLAFAIGLVFLLYTLIEAL